MRQYIKLFIFCAIIFAQQGVNGQKQVLDEVIAVIGDGIIRQSDIEQQYLQMRASGMKGSATLLRCQVFEDLLVQKLFYHQSLIDSVDVTEAEVELQIGQRLDYFTSQLGSEEAIERYFNKTIYEIKEEFRDPIREQLATEKMQRELLTALSITPEEVKKFYKNIPKDSIPVINTQVSYRQINIYPPHSEQQIFSVKQRLLELRERIVAGEDFSTLAILYSEGPSAPNGGEIGFLGKGQLDKEYAKVAFALKPGQVSRIVESDFGYHIIQLIEKKNDRVNTRHILMKPKVSIESTRSAKSKLDSLAQLVRQDSLTFKVAAARFSEDEDSRMSGGLVFNPMDASSNFQMEQLNPADYYILKDLKISQISDPYESVDSKGKRVYKIVKLEKRIDEHTANIKDDYFTLKQIALSAKQQEVITDWVYDKIRRTYLEISPDHQTCDFLHKKGWIQ